MRKLYIIGAGGFGAEVEWLVNELQQEYDLRYSVEAFVNQLLDDPQHVQKKDGQTHCGLPVISGRELLEITKSVVCELAIAIGDVGGRRGSFFKLPSTNINFPTLIHPSVVYDDRKGRIIFSEGTIVCANTTLTTNIQVGKFVHINLDCTIGHDVIIHDFCTLSPGVHISGKVIIEEGVFLGTGAVVLPGIKIGHNSTIGAGAVVTKDIPSGVIAVGIPAKIVNKN